MQRCRVRSKTWRIWLVAAALACTSLVEYRVAYAQDAAADALHTASRVELDVVKLLLAQEKAWNAGDLEG
jgi:hypothetical protein